MLTERWETVIEVGQTITASGVVSVEPAPADLARGAIYRDGPTVKVLRGRDARGVSITGLGAAAPLGEGEKRALAAGERRARPLDRWLDATPAGRARRRADVITLVAATAVLIAALLHALGRM